NFASSFGDARRCPQAPKDPTGEYPSHRRIGCPAAAGAIWVVQEKKRLKNLVAKLLLSSAKLFSLRNYVSSKSLWTGTKSLFLSFIVLSITSSFFFKDWTWSMQARDAKPVPADESCQIPMAQQDVDGEIDSSDDGMPSPPLEAYTNRLRPFGVQFDAENGS
ncbi:unnamed protein product, partial [Brassica rapa subsp. trilocularis]